MFWRMFTRMERKIDDWFLQHLECRERQQKEFVKLDDFKDLEKNREKRWETYFFPHTHYPDELGGGVKILKQVVREGS